MVGTTLKLERWWARYKGDTSSSIRYDQHPGFIDHDGHSDGILQSVHIDDSFVTFWDMLFG